MDGLVACWLPCFVHTKYGKITLSAISLTDTGRFMIKITCNILEFLSRINGNITLAHFFIFPEKKQVILSD